MTVGTLLFLFTFTGGIDLRGVTPPEPATYQLDAYVDRPPKGESWREDVLVGQSGRGRILYIVAYKRLDGGRPWQWLEDRHVYAPDFELIGKPDEVDRLLDAPIGSRVVVQVRHVRATHTLVLHQVVFSSSAATEPTDEDSVVP
jgi:hypothetical protein